ncbi:MAG: hypothetical protein SynsKO_15850 [Synoicihabitans sp.]
MPQFVSRLLFLFLATSLASLSAQSVRWQLASGYFAKGQTQDLVLIFDNCVPDGDITLPVVPNVNFGTPQQGTHSTQSIINGRVTSQVLTYFSYPSLALDDGPVTIPDFQVQTDKGTMTVTGVQFDVREATIGDTQIPVSQVAQSALQIADGEIWAGEVVPISYSLDVSARFRANLGGAPEWSPEPLIAEEWNEPSRTTNGVGRTARNVLTYATRGYVKTPGSYVVPSVQQLVNIGIPTAGIFQSLRAEQYAITSDSPRLEVKPLPSAAPASFDGAVGEFVLESKVVPASATVGEPITWTLELKGTGNWPDISRLPARQVAQSFRVVQPEARREIPEAKLFEGTITEDVVLIPTQAGEFSLGPVAWSYFDPVAGRYQTITAAAETLSISPAVAAPRPATSGQPPSAESPAPGPLAINATPAPDSPSTLPLEVLSGTASSPVPMTTRTLVRTGVGIAALFPVLWFALSLARARRLDPGRTARIARQRLSSAIQTVESSSGEALTTALRQWRGETARLWQFDHAAPTETLFRANEDWAKLWQEADRVLYAEDADLPNDWTDRARQALAAKKAPRFPILSAFSPRHLFPVIAVLLILTSATDGIAAGAQSYREGDFEAAEAFWRDAIVAEPTDWIAHHNLALALAQQNRWDEAGAQAAVAFVQNPRHPSTRWHLNYTLDRSGYTPPVIGKFLTPDWSAKIARNASPAEWQLLLLGGVLLLLIVGVLVLIGAYLRLIPGGRIFCSLGAILAVVLMASSTFSIQYWGTTADADAALTWQAGELRSIPTDLDSAQQTTPLAAGSLCVIERAFLGWRQISFPNGQTGWVRKEALIPLWDRAP